MHRGRDPRVRDYGEIGKGPYSSRLPTARDRTGAISAQARGVKLRSGALQRPAAEARVRRPQAGVPLVRRSIVARRLLGRREQQSEGADQANDFVALPLRFIPALLASIWKNRRCGPPTPVNSQPSASPSMRPSLTSHICTVFHDGECYPCHNVTSLRHENPRMRQERPQERMALPPLAPHSHRNT